MKLPIEKLRKIEKKELLKAKFFIDDKVSFIILLLNGIRANVIFDFNLKNFNQAQKNNLQKDIDYINKNFVAETCRTPQIIKAIPKAIPQIGSLKDYFKDKDTNEFKQHEYNLVKEFYNIEEDLYLEVPIQTEKDSKIEAVRFFIFKKEEEKLYSENKDKLQEIFFHTYNKSITLQKV